MKRYNYNNYLKSKYWKDFKNKCKEIKKYRCHICRSKEKLCLHHKRYYKHGESILFRETKSDVMWLCENCHNKIHKYGIEQYVIDGSVKRVELKKFLKRI